MLNQWFRSTPKKKSLNPTGFSKADIFSLSGVEKSFDNVKALTGINLEVAKGDVLFITGPSGAGKSTLLKLLSGELRPTLGHIDSPPPNIFVAEVFQDGRFLEKSTCYENLLTSFDMSVYCHKKEFFQDMNELARLLGVEDKLQSKMYEISGGMRQKIALMRALLAKPDVLIADEPTCSLDRDSSKVIFNILNIYNIRRGMTVIWSSHNRELVKAFSGRVVHLDKGRIIHTGHACFI